MWCLADLTTKLCQLHMADFFPKLAVQAWMREDGQKLKSKYFLSGKIQRRQHLLSQSRVVMF